MKKILCLFLSVITLTGILAACGGEEASPVQKDVTLWYGYNTENFMQDYEYPEEMKSRDSTLRMYGIRGDVESVQLMITSSKDIKSFNVKVNDLVNADGKKIGKSNIEVYAQWYVNVEGSYNTKAGNGMYPDALVPIMSLVRARENYITAGNNQGLWFEVRIPETAKPGVYTGTATLTLGREIYDIPIEVTVYDAVMPEEVHTHSCYRIEYNYMHHVEGTKSGELAQAYYDFLVERRCMPMLPSPSISEDYDAFVDWLVTNCAENPKVSTYGLPYTETTDANGKPIVSRERLMELFTKMAMKNVELRQTGNESIDLFKKAMFYMGNLVDAPTGEKIEQVKACDLVLTECKYAVAEEYLKDYPDLYQSLLEVRNLVTTVYNENLVGSDTEGGVQTWGSTLTSWDNAEQRQNYYDRQNSTDRKGGEEAWWYGCSTPYPPFPTYHIDDELIGSRILSWMQFDYGSDGTLYWSVNNSFSQYNFWENAVAVSGAMGDGSLIYPAGKFRLSEPVSTLRLESIREGQEDYEYLWMIEQAILQYNAENGTNHDPEALMAPLYEGLYEGMQLVRGQPELFLEKRLAVLDVLQTITADPAAGIAALQAK